MEYKTHLNCCHFFNSAIYTYMATITTIKGEWIKEGSHYINPLYEFTLIMANRKHPTENKPNRYILIKHPDKKVEYLSGLFSTLTDGVYRIDYRGKNYTIEHLDTTHLFIKPTK